MNKELIKGIEIPNSPKLMEIKEIPIWQARRLNEKWHSRLPKIIESNITRCPKKACYGAFFKGECFAVAILSSPVARKLNGLQLIELRRLAISPDAPKNTASWILGKIAKQIKVKFPDVLKIISYQDTEVHTGMIYKASNWEIGNISNGHEWNCNSRPRNKIQTTAPKVRWEYKLNG